MSAPELTQVYATGPLLSPQVRPAPPTTCKPPDLTQDSEKLLPSLRGLMTLPYLHPTHPKKVGGNHTTLICSHPTVPQLWWVSQHSPHPGQGPHSGVGWGLFWLRQEWQDLGGAWRTARHVGSAAPLPTGGWGWVGSEAEPVARGI